MGVMVFTTDHACKRLSARIPQRRPDQHDRHVAALSVPLDRSTSPEIAVLRGPLDHVRQEATAYFSSAVSCTEPRVLLPVSESGPGHAHADGEGEDHRHLRVKTSFPERWPDRPEKA